MVKSTMGDIKVPTLNQPVTNFSFTTTDQEQENFANLRGKNVVLYFYPKDDTPGCTLESKTFNDFYPEFTKHNTLVLGVSRDNLKSHHKFKDKYCLNFPLITDEKEELCEYFNVIKLKNMYGKKVRGIERSTFLIDKNGILQREWRNVKVEGHIEEVLAAVKSLK